ncbi:MAG: patatin-like phospholipase family protein [Alicycliphilus sp.]|uniref:CBASS cGAMP-activated phospholipase n=1 Tax=Diaphorobacter limosus TaxID=3036128 RepID=A0ABZ0IYY4_9BURK|nr:CBASS cGAMP-activated phospholipase [Diaphorobacter sp. Y-1]MBP6752312.1 patatin-like phospholipase family protein [Alicycliphilus sp.]MBP8779989.1 patatin-like phospholipase family protein [Alicycliphilus sp.]TXJ08258.1 MAG: patatin [Alicycliphilus sp.]WOO31214.1 CBASS cGAMP-activated phospholipase [Diaphorobacter sp. Y-1]HRM49796.1 CBASS cGAMP-activated phospholipase [Alicycliphilus sp.]
MSAPEDEPFTLPAGLPRAAPGRVRVLSLSGGGYRGLFTAALIRALEARLGPDPARPTPFGQRFDLIAGTSIGGILATALSCRATGAALQALLQRRGSSIFPPMRLRGLRKLLGRAPYDPQRLRSAICELLPDAEQQLLGEHAPALLLTTVNWTTSKLQLLGSRPTLGQRDQLGLTLMDAMLATSAAPAHFPVHSFQHHRFVDGGLAANAPDLHALQCAQQMYPGAEVHMLSIGTANPLHGRDPSAVPGRGLMWAGPVIELVTSAQEMLAVQECAARMGTHRYLRLNMPPSSAQQKQLDFDVADQTSTDLLLSLADDCLASLQPADWHRLKAIVG